MPEDLADGKSIFVQKKAWTYGSKFLPEPVLIQIYVAIWCH